MLYSGWNRIFASLNNVQGRNMENIMSMATSQGGIITTAELSNNSEYQRMLRANGRGELVRIRHGVYAVPDVLLNTMIDVERIVPKGIVCLYNAWAYHQLSMVVPPSFCIAIEAKRKVAIPPTVPIELYYWKKENLKFGVENVKLSGYNIRITDMERSVCDAVKYRNKIGMELCSEVLRNYLKKKSRNLSRLSDYAKRLRVANILKNYIEIAIE